MNSLSLMIRMYSYLKMQGVHLSQERFISCFSGRQRPVSDSYLHCLILKQVQLEMINMLLWEITLSPNPEYLLPAWGLKRMEEPCDLRPRVSGTASWRRWSWPLHRTNFQLTRRIVLLERKQLMDQAEEKRIQHIQRTSSEKLWDRKGAGHNF